MKLQGALSLFIIARQAEGKSPRTIEFYQGNIERYIGYVTDAGALGCRWAQPETIEKYLADERAAGLSDLTVHARYRALRAFCNWMTKRGMIDRSPVDQIEQPKLSKKPPKQISLTEFQTLLGAIPGGDGASWGDHRDRLIIQILFWSGIRLGELVALRLDDLDGGSRLIRIRQGKGKQARFVPYPAGMETGLLRYLMALPVCDMAGGLCCSDDGNGGARGSLGRGGVRQMLKRRCRLAGIRYHSPHAFRHGFAMAMLNAGGIEMGVLSKLLGHSDVRVTQGIYADWETATLKRAYLRAEAAIVSDYESGDGGL